MTFALHDSHPFTYQTAITMKSTPAPVQSAGWLRKPAIPPFLPALVASSILRTYQAASYVFINIDL